VEQIERDRKNTAEAQALCEHQIAALRERVALEEADAKDYQRHARLVLRNPPARGEDRSIEEASALLESAHAKFPNDASILELLISCYLRSDPERRLDDTVRQLERVAPDSDVLHVLSAIEDSDAIAYSQALLHRVQRLFEQSQTNDQALRQTALNELRFVVRAFPANSDYRWFYAMALIGAGRLDEALQQAEVMARAADESHSRHFNVAQVFWHCNARECAQHHLDLALQYATTDEERQDVHTLRAQLNG
jgi:hypothetical protein